MVKHFNDIERTLYSAHQLSLFCHRFISLYTLRELLPEATKIIHRVQPSRKDVCVRLVHQSARFAGGIVLLARSASRKIWNRQAHHVHGGHSVLVREGRSGTDRHR